MANNQNQKNRDDQTTNNQTNNAQRTQQDDQRTMQQGERGQRVPGTGEQGQDRKNAPGRQDQTTR